MFSKLVGKVNFSEKKKFLKKCISFEEGIFGETFILALSSSAVFHLQISVSDFF